MEARPLRPHVSPCLPGERRQQRAAAPVGLPSIPRGAVAAHGRAKRSRVRRPARPGSSFRGRGAPDARAPIRARRRVFPWRYSVSSWLRLAERRGASQATPLGSASFRGWCLSSSSRSSTSAISVERRSASISVRCPESVGSGRAQGTRPGGWRSPATGDAEVTADADLKSAARFRCRGRALRTSNDRFVGVWPSTV